MSFKLLFNLLFLALSLNYNSYAAIKGVNKDITKQIYTNKFGAVMINGNQFKVDTAYGSHCCSLEGKLEFTTPDRALFKEIKPDTATESIVEFKFDDNSVEVNILEGDKSGWCGMHGQFEWKYFKDGIYETSFKCSKNNTPVEELICKNRILAEADLQLNDLYHNFKVSHPSLLLKQQSWLETRNNCLKKGCTEKDPVTCILKSYLKRIYELQNVAAGQEEVTSKNNTDKYNFSYFLTSLKQKDNVSIFHDALLQNYLKELLNVAEFKNFSSGFVEIIDRPIIEPLPSGEEVIFFHGGAPGLYTICESAVAIAQDNKIWLAFIDDTQKSLISVLMPKGTDKNDIPKHLMEWINDLESRQGEYKTTTQIKHFE